MADGGKVVIKIDGDDSGFQKTLSGLGKLGTTALKGVAVGAAAVGTALVGTATALGAIAENTREYREDLNRLDAAFLSSGKSVEVGRQSYEGFYKILGESDRSIEAVNHLAQLTDNTQELSQWTNIAAGVAATFGDSLPIEGLTEAANETAKVGQVTGPLADALNWAGISEDEFNQKLAACNSEQERATLITDTLSQTYEGAAEQFNELNKNVMESREATLLFNNALAQIGGAVEPILTSLKMFGAEALQGLADGITMLTSGNISGGLTQISQTITNTLNDIVNKANTLLPQVLPIFVELVTSIATTLAEALPMVAQTIASNLPLIVESIVQIGVAIIESLPSMVESIVSMLPTLLPVIIEGVTQLILALAEALPEIVMVIVDYLPEIITAVVSALMESLPQLIEGMLMLVTALIEALPEILQALTEVGPMIWESVLQGLLESLPVLIQGLFQMWLAIGQAVVESAVVLGQAYIDFYKRIFEMILEIFAPIVEWFGNLFSQAWQAIQNAWSGVVSWFSDIWDSIVEAFSDVANWFGNMFSQAWEAIKSAWSVAVSFFSGIWNGIVAIFSVVGSWFRNMFSQAWEAVKNAWSSATSFFSGIWDNIVSVFSPVASWFGSMFQSAWNAITSVWNNVTSYFSGIWNNIKSAFRFDEMFSIGRNIVQGLINGISNAAGALYEKAKSLATGALNSMKSALGIHSPSAVMRDEVGKMITKGLAIGIEDGQSEVSKVIKEITDEMNKDLLDSEKLYLDEKARLEKEAADKELQEKLDNAETQEEIEKIKNEQILKEQEEAQDAYLDSLKEVAERERKIYDARVKDVENAQQEIVDTFQNLADEALDSIEEVENAQEDLADKFKDFGDLYIEETRKRANDTTYDVIELADIEEQTKALEEYADKLLKIKERGDIPQEFFENLRDMSIEEGNKFADLLLAADDEAFNKYIKDWQDKQDTAEELSKILYGDEAEAVKNEIEESFENFDADLKAKGEENASAWGEGFLEEIRKRVPVIFDEINSALTTSIGVPSYAMAGAGTVNNYTTYTERAPIVVNATMEVDGREFGKVTLAEVAKEIQRKGLKVLR